MIVFRNDVNYLMKYLRIVFATFSYSVISTKLDFSLKHFEIENIWGCFLHTWNDEIGLMLEMLFIL